MLSIDSGKNIYPYFRTGNWEVLKQNIETFKNLDTKKQFALTIVCTTSAYQIMDIYNVFESFLTLDVDNINSSIVYTPKYINPALMMIEHKESVLEDIKKVKELIMKEKIRRFTNLEETSKNRSWNSLRKVFTDIQSAQLAIENIEQYILNNSFIKQEEYEALKVYIRKSDSIWKQNFNDYFVNYKYENGQIVRVKQ
jgi:hypothetical protein